VVEVFMEKAGAPICAKMSQEKALSLDFPRTRCPSKASSYPRLPSLQDSITMRSQSPKTEEGTW